MDANTLQRLYDEALIAQYDPVRLAIIAAPFMASGLPLDAALDSADLLLSQAMSRLGKTQMDQIRRLPSVSFDLNTFLDQLGIKGRDTLRKYVEGALPDGVDVWTMALAGERVFTRERQKLIIAHREHQKILQEARRRQSRVRKSTKK